MKNKLHLSLLAIVMLSISAFSQVSDAEKKAVDYLNNKLETNITCLLNTDNQEILSADVYESSLEINLGNKYNNSSVNYAYFLINKDNAYAFKSVDEILHSEQFIAALNKNFKLMSEEDGVKLRSIFFVFDDESREDFFKIDNTWYFIKSDFFGDMSGYIVSTDGKGNVTKIETDRNMEIEKPETVLGDASNIRFEKLNDDYINDDIAKLIDSKLRDEANYAFELALFTIPNFSSNIQLYDGQLVISETYGDGGESTTTYSYVLLSDVDEYTVAETKEKLIYNEMFSNAVVSEMTIKNEEEAQAFESFLDNLQKAEPEIIKHYKEDDIWFFYREKSFDDLYGYMVKISDDGNIKYWDYTELSDQSILKFKMQDPDMVVDYAFTLIKPSSTSLQVTESDVIPVEISFDEDPVNAQGAWILTQVDGEMAGMSASTNMESPFTDEIPVSYLGKGTHVVEYLLLPPGQDTENAYGKISLEIEVK